MTQKNAFVQYFHAYDAGIYEGSYNTCAVGFSDVVFSIMHVFYSLPDISGSTQQVPTHFHLCIKHLYYVTEENVLVA